MGCGMDTWTWHVGQKCFLHNHSSIHCRQTQRGSVTILLFTWTPTFCHLLFPFLHHRLYSVCVLPLCGRCVCTAALRCRRLLDSSRYDRSDTHCPHRSATQTLYFSFVSTHLSSLLIPLILLLNLRKQSISSCTWLLKSSIILQSKPGKNLNLLLTCMRSQ